MNYLCGNFNKNYYNMKKLLLSFIILLTSWFVGSAGSLNHWTNYNFQGVWEITSDGTDGDIGWLIKNIAGSTFGNAPITKLELALDVNGWGYIAFYSEQNAGKFDVRGRIFIPGIDDARANCLSLVCANDYTNLTYGLISFNVSAYNGDSSDYDAFIISPFAGSAKAKAIRVSTIYIPDSVSQIAAPSMQLQFMADGISVVDAEEANVAVYDIDGILVYQTQNYGGETIRLHKGTNYIVKVNEDSMKISF